MTTNEIKYSVNMEASRSKSTIPEVNKESLIQMMKEIMENSLTPHDQLHCVVQESHECSESMVENLLVDQFEQENAQQIRPQKDMYKREQCEKRPCQIETPKQLKHTINDLKKNQAPFNVIDSSKSDNKSSSLWKNTEESVLSSNQTTQFDKLIEITSRCVEYYNNFIKEKSAEFVIIQKTFTDLNSNLDMAFDEIISEAQRKQKQLKEFLVKKYKEIIEYRQCQDNGLKDTLESIRSVHLSNIMKKEKPQKEPQSKDTKRKIFLSLNSKLETSTSVHENSSEKVVLNSYSSQQSDSLSLEVHNYATTLNQFYLQMEEIEKSNFKEIVEESVSFINNLICQELKVLMTEKIPSRLCEKRMIRQNSKDFLMEENEISAKTYNGQNLAFLDFESFTKLFAENSKLINGDEQNFNDNKKIEELIFLIDQKNKPKVNQKNNFMKEKVLTTRNSNNQKVQKSSEKKPSSKPKTSYHVTTVVKKQNLLATDHHSNKSLQKATNFHKKDHPQQLIEPSKNPNEDAHKQNSLQLIKKISSQQNNRSAKIKSYMVSFQDNTKQKVTLKANKNKKEEEKILNKTHSKSPGNIGSKTPVKLTKSNEKKSLVSSQVVRSPNQIKFKTSQQTSLKSSRNTSYVSEFKIASSRRQSVALK